MVDEMEELRRANPFSIEQAASVLQTDRLEVGRSDAASGWHLEQERPARPHEEPTRSKRALTGVLAAAAVVLAFLGFAVTNRNDSGGLIEASVAAPVGDSETMVLQAGGAGFDRSNDLLVIHLDFADSSDIHTSVAAREVADWFALEPVVVAGTMRPSARPAPADPGAAMSAAWGDRWFDAQQDWAQALAQSRDRWLVTLDAGGHVWVAEAGVSDFTADVVRSIVLERPEIATERLIHVVQHTNQNEAATTPQDLALVQSLTEYRRIEPGDRANSTADLDGPTDSFDNAVRNGRHGERWADAFELRSVGDLDFADLVTILDILGVATEHVATPDDYAAFFIGDQPDAALRGES